jgi:excisionase family DNA binding protein
MKLLRLSECAERTDTKESTWRAWVLQRRVPYYRVGRRSVRISEEDLQKMIDGARVPARDEQ